MLSKNGMIKGKAKIMLRNAKKVMECMSKSQSQASLMVIIKDMPRLLTSEDKSKMMKKLRRRKERRAMSLISSLTSKRKTLRVILRNKTSPKRGQNPNQKTMKMTPKVQPSQEKINRPVKWHSRQLSFLSNHYPYCSKRRKSYLHLPFNNPTRI